MLTMKDEVSISVSRILTCLVFGAVSTIVLLVMMGFGVAPRLLRPILWPGLQLAQMLSYGVDDWHASVLLIVGNGLSYGTVLFVAMLVTRKR